MSATTETAAFLAGTQNGTVTSEIVNLKKAGMPAHVCNPPREAETGKSQVGGQPGLHQKITEMLLFQLCMYMWGVCVCECTKGRKKEGTGGKEEGEIRGRGKLGPESTCCFYRTQAQFPVSTKQPATTFNFSFRGSNALF